LSVIDTAILRIQTLALACSSSDVTVKQAPTYPIDSAMALPLVITHILGGNGRVNEATTLKLESTLAVDFHFNRQSLKQAYTEINAIWPAFQARMAGDPTLNGAVDTIQFPIPGEILPAEWDGVTTQMLRFTVQVKTLETPVST